MTVRLSGRKGNQGDIQNLTVNTNVTRSSFVWFRYVVFNATFNILFGEEAGVSDENHLATVSH
jgi:hypothetical protein